MTAAAAQLISSLAVLAQRLNELSVAVKSSPAARLVRSSITPRRLADGDRVECYVDAELTSGTAVGWWLEFWFSDGSWRIESSVRYNTENGEEELIGLPTRFAVDDEELIGELDGASRALVETLGNVDLENL